MAFSAYIPDISLHVSTKSIPGLSSYHRIIHYNPPGLGKLDSTRTKIFTPAQIIGIQVDILKFPASYTEPNL